MDEYGWGPCPPVEILRNWERLGGHWRRRCERYSFPHLLYQGDWIEDMIRSGGPDYNPRYKPKDGVEYQPVHSDCGYNHESWMWAAATGEALVPTEPGWWAWQETITSQIQMVLIWECPGFGLVASEAFMFGAHRHPEDIGGHWLGPCTLSRIPESVCKMMEDK